MFFGFEDSLRELKKDLKDAGADMAFVREWQKSFDKVKKQSPILEKSYLKAQQDLRNVKCLLEQMEKILIADKGASVELTKHAQELKKYQSAFEQEFLISSEDSDFHLTYKSILALASRRLYDPGEILILQSEVENLLALTEEALQKEWPSFHALAYFYLHRTDREIYDLPHMDKVDKVRRIYENEFMKPMREVLIDCINREPECMSFLIEGGIRTPEESAEYILEDKIWI